MSHVNKVDQIKEISGVNPLKCMKCGNVLLPAHLTMRWTSNHTSSYLTVKTEM